jgi:parallel beta-helix repeat protein
LLLGAAGGFFGPVIWSRFANAAPRTLIVGPGGITATLNQAHSGDTVVIPQGRYRERIELRQGVTLRAQVAGTVTLTSPDGGPALIARKIDAGGVEGVWIQGDLEAPLSTGIEISDSSPFVSNVKVTGAGTGIEVRGASAPAITSSQITSNLGAGIVVSPSASPRIESNLIAANGNGTPGEARPGVEVMEKAHPLLKDNGIVDNGAEPIWIHGRAYQPADFEENFFGGLPAKKAIKLIDDTEDRGAGK